MMGDPVDDATHARTREPSLVDAIVPLGALAGLIAASMTSAVSLQPNAVFTIASPLLSVAYGFTGLRIAHTALAEEAT